MLQTIVLPPTGVQQNRFFGPFFFAYFLDAGFIRFIRFYRRCTAGVADPIWASSIINYYPFTPSSFVLGRSRPLEKTKVALGLGYRAAVALDLWGAGRGGS